MAKKKKQSYAEFMKETYGATNDYVDKVQMPYREKQAEADDDIAPVKTTTTEKDDSKLDFFQKGVFEDGYQFGDVTKGVLGTVGDLGVGVLKGAGRLVEGITDLGMYGFAETVGVPELAQKAKDKAKEDTVSKLSKGADDFLDKYSFMGKTSDSVAEGIGQVATIILTGGVAGALGASSAGATAITTGTLFASSVGSGQSEAYNAGATEDEAVKYGLIKGAVDAGTELLFGGLGKSVKALGLSKGLTSIDDVFAKKLSSKISSQFYSNLVEFGVKSSAEGVEEVLAGIGTAVGKKLTYMSDEELKQLVEDENLMEQFVVGAVSSGIAQSGIAPGMQNGSLIEANKQGTDFISGLTQNEQKVIDKVFENRIAEAEKDGKTLSKKEKTKLYDEVMSDLEKGYVSTDTIEEVLGGESYEAYKNTVDSEEALQKEFDTLNKMKQGEMTGEQIDRRTELKQQLEELKSNSQRDSLKTKLSEDVLSLVNQDGTNLKSRGSFLAESYNEKANRGKVFEADVSKYDTKQQETIKKAVESGILNNTRRTHEFVDFIAKISADKGVSFDFTNNAKIKETGFAIDGKTVNGYVTKDGIALNIDSAKALNSTVGHEITHILEGTEFYTELQTAIFEYAKSKNDYQVRYDTLTKLYEGVEGADIDAELTADLVGDYLFQDSDFVNRLSVEHRNIFQKIYDEIKYLCKVVTAGSKEARQLEKVKKAFDEAYRNGGKAQTDTKYSLSDSDGKTLSKGQQEYFKNSKMRDENGNLKVMYHGSQDAGFHEFNSRFSDDDTSFFFVDRNDVAASYSGTSETYEAQTIHTAEDMNKFIESIDAEGYEVVEQDGKFILLYEGDRVAASDTAKGIYEEFCWYEGVGEGDANYKVYLNLTNPLIVDAEGRNWNNISREFSQEIVDKYNSLTTDEKEALTDLAEWGEYGIFRDEILSAAKDNVDGIVNYATADLLSAYKKLGGANANLYDAFSIASDNFSEESLKQFAVKQMNTRDYAKKAKAEGYDGVIFNNLVDNGGYSNGSEGASTVAIAFDSNQIKSVANDEPTSDPDIRYSLSPEADKTYLSAVERGDMETAQKMVNEAAENSMSNSKVRDENGNLYTVYHGSASKFTVFDHNKMNTNGNAHGRGFYFTEDINLAEGYEKDGGQLLKGFLNIEKPLSEEKVTIKKADLVKLIKATCEGEAQSLVNDGGYDSVREALLDTWVSNYVNTYEMNINDAYKEVANIIYSGNDNDVDIIAEITNAGAGTKNTLVKTYEVLGYDGVIYTNPEGKHEFVSLVSNQFKSTDPVTYDDNGDVIPLSKRFNFDDEDIRNSLSAEGETFKKYGNYAVSAKDLRLERDIAHTREDIETPAENVAQIYTEPVSTPLTAEEEAEFEKARLESLEDSDAPIEQETDYTEMHEKVQLPKTKVVEIAKRLREELGLSNRQMYLARGLIEEYSKNESLSRDELYETIKSVFGTQTFKEDVGVKDVQQFLRNSKIQVSETIKGDIADYKTFRRSLARKIGFSQEGIPVDTAYQELTTLYPEFFPDDIANPTDQFLRMAEVATMERTVEEEIEVDDETLLQAADIIVNEVNAYNQNWTQKLAERAAKQPISQRDVPATEAEIDSRVEKLYKSLAGKPIERLQRVGGYSFYVSRNANTDSAKIIIEKSNGEKLRHNIANAKNMTDAQLWHEAAEMVARAEMPYVMEGDAHPVKETYDPQKARLERSLNRIDKMLEYDKEALADEIKLRREETNGDYDQYALDKEYESRLKELEEAAEIKRQNAKTANQRISKQEEINARMETLVGDTSTWVDKKLGLSYKTNTLRRNLRDVVRDANGKRDIARADAIYDELQGKYNIHEAELNREANRIKKVYADMKITNAESTYIQMLGEFRHNPKTTLTEKQVKDYLAKHKNSIDEAKVNKAISLARDTYDSLLVRVNEVLREQGMKEIPYRQGYFPHFNEEKQGFLAKLFNWKTQNNDIPTDIAGITEQFNPNRSWQAFNKQRKGDTTEYNFLKGMDTYVQGALDWIYHIEDIQNRRALENYIRYTHSEEGVKQKIEAIRANEEYDADEMQEQIDLVYATAKNPLNNFVTDLRAGTNNLANKKSSLDRGMEEMVNRKVYSTMTNLSNRVSANMVGGSVSSALTNFIPITQSWGEVSPISSLRAMGDTIKSTFRDDGMVDKSAFLTNRLRKSENLYKTTWDKIGDGVGILMEGIDAFSSQTVWRSKYLENISDGMSESEAIKNADQFAENVIGGRSRGNQPTLFDSKNPLVKTLTAFQLEVNNQYGYMFKDMPLDVKNGSKARLIKGYATMFLGAYAYNALYSALTGRDSAFDPIGIVEGLLRDLGLFGDDEEEEKDPVDAVLNLAENIAQEVPFVGGLMGGGRVPISSALPYEGNFMDFLEGSGNVWRDKEWKSVSDFISDKDLQAATKEWLKPAYYLAMPMGGGQIKKTVEGLSMFSEDHPIAGSYTNSGALRFPVEDTIGNRVKAGIFGQWANENAREYIESGHKPLEEKQIQEFMDIDVPIGDYWKYREGLKGLKKLEEKVEYINGLDLADWQKNLLVNNIADRKEDIDMSDYDSYSDFEEFDFAHKNPEKYQFFKENGISYEDYASADEDGKRAYSWAAENPEKYIVSKAVTSDVVDYKQYTRELYDIRADYDSSGKAISGSSKAKKTEYINNLPLDYGQRIILYRSLFDSQKDKDAYNADIVEYLNGRDDISYEEMVTILEELDMTVYADGTVKW